MISQHKGKKKVGSSPPGVTRAEHTIDVKLGIAQLFLKKPDSAAAPQGRRLKVGFEQATIHLPATTAIYRYQRPVSKKSVDVIKVLDTGNCCNTQTHR
jgi:hypothetical protein